MDFSFYETHFSVEYRFISINVHANLYPWQYETTKIGMSVSKFELCFMHTVYIVHQQPQRLMKFQATTLTLIFAQTFFRLTATHLYKSLPLYIYLWSVRVHNMSSPPPIAFESKVLYGLGAFIYKFEVKHKQSFRNRNGSYHNVSIKNLNTLPQ